jgi:hypothetical protein
VIVPFFAKAGFRPANLSGKNFWHSSSRETLRDPLLSSIITSHISQAKLPASYACRARL